MSPVDARFIDAERLRKSWGNMAPRAFLDLVSFGGPEDSLTLRAYQRDTRKEAELVEPDDEHGIDFSNFIDGDGKMDPAVLQELCFKFVDIKKYTQENESWLPQYIEFNKMDVARDEPGARDGGDIGSNQRLAGEKTYQDENQPEKSIVFSEKDDLEILRDLGLDNSGECQNSEMAREAADDFSGSSAVDGSGRIKWTPPQKAIERCRAIAALILDQCPDLRPSQIADCVYIKEFGLKLKRPDGTFVDTTEVQKKTICGWISDICPNTTKGRPSKDEMLTEIIIKITTKKNPAKS